MIDMWEKIWELEGDRLFRSITTFPSTEDWGVCLVLFIGYGAIALPWGLWTGLLKLEWVTSWRSIFSTMLVTLIFPSLIEESLFRVMLLPHPEENLSTDTIVLWSAVSLVIFILAHHLNALWVLKSRRNTFWDFSFLALAGLLGLVCTFAYLYSGSFWLPVILHWLVVLIWLLCFGGDRRMSLATK